VIKDGSRPSTLSGSISDSALQYFYRLQVHTHWVVPINFILDGTPEVVDLSRHDWNFLWGVIIVSAMYSSINRTPSVMRRCLEVIQRWEASRNSSHENIPRYESFFNFIR